MPKRFPGWAESGARLPLDVDVEFTSRPSPFPFPNFLSQDECQRAVGAARQYQEGYAELAHRAMEAGVSLYKMRRKNHMIAHQIWFIEETGLNPKFWGCWMDEDLMGKLRTICQATKARGVAVVRASLKRWLWCRLQNNFIMGRAEYVWGQ